MKPTDDLIEEHKTVKEMLKIVGRVSRKLEEAEEVTPEHIESIINFLQIFVDKCHHRKEENLLFPAMEEAGILKEVGLIEQLLVEHEQGRKYIKVLFDELEGYKQGQKSASLKISENGKMYNALLEQHIKKEDSILFPNAGGLSNDKQQELLEGFEKIEEEVIGIGKHEEFHRTLHHLSEIYLD